MKTAPDVTARLLGALASATDPNKLSAALAEAGFATSEPRPSERVTVTTPHGVLASLVLEDVLDDAILGARPGDAAFPIRALLGELATRLASGEGLAFAAGLNFYFRQPQADEEIRLTVALEVSRAFYRFAEHAGLDRRAVRDAAPLMAQLLSTELTRTELQCVDHAIVFDSNLHDRSPGSDPQSSRVVSARSFLAKVKAGGQVKKRALVVT